MQWTLRLLICLTLSAVGLLSTSARSSAAPPEPQAVDLECVTDMFVQPLGRTVPANAEGQALVLIRVIFEPGGSIGPHTHPGTLVLTVESGKFGFTLADDGEMTAMRSGEPGEPVVEEIMPPNQEVELVAGDWFVELGMAHSARAIGDEPAVVIFSGLIADGQPLTTCL
jgi:quercetin dioxygenase-like cupin family protein